MELNKVSVVYRRIKNLKIEEIENCLPNLFTNNTPIVLVETNPIPVRSRSFQSLHLTKSSIHFLWEIIPKQDLIRIKRDLGRDGRDAWTHVH